MPILNRLLERLPIRSRPLVETAIYGLAAAFSAVAFEIAIHKLFYGTFERFALLSPWLFVVTSFAFVITTSLASGVLLTKFAPEAAGSGIPQLKLAFWKDFGYMPWQIAVVKFVAGVLAVGGGASLGREGPSVQLAGAVASNLAGSLGTAKNGRRRATAAGAAAGLAATFNTPLAAIAFVLEEILGDLNSSLLGSVVVAAVLGAFVVHGILGSHPAFILPTVETSTWTGRLTLPMVAIFASLVGVWFQRLALGLRRYFRTTSLSKIPAWARPACGAYFSWVIGVIVFLLYGKLGIFSLGYEDLDSGLAGNIIGIVPFVLLIAKLGATVLSYGSGGCGGIFSPSLFLGAMTGSAFEESLKICGVPFTDEDRLLFMIIGMSSCLGAVVRAPFTSMLIVFEMTREFSLIPELLVAGIISQTFSRWLMPHGFYEQVLRDDDQILDHVIPPRDFRDWERYPASVIANYHPFIIDKLDKESLKRALGRVYFSRILHQSKNQSPGIVLRSEVIASVGNGHAVPLYPVPTCLRTDSIERVQRLLVDSRHGVVVLLDRKEGCIIGLVTLHDLLRAQHQIATQQAQ